MTAKSKIFAKDLVKKLAFMLAPLEYIINLLERFSNDCRKTKTQSNYSDQSQQERTWLRNFLSFCRDIQTRQKLRKFLSQERIQA